MRSTDRVRAAAERLGLPLTIVEMPASTRTAAEAAAACGTSVERIVKSLVFAKAGSGEPVLVLASGVNRVDQDAIAAEIGEALVRMDAGEVRKVTGFAIGGVAPIGSLTPLPTFMDAELMQHATVWAAAGAPYAVFEVAPEALARATEARIVKLR